MLQQIHRPHSFPARVRVRLWAVGAPALGSLQAHACTVCDSQTAHEVRSGIFNGHFTATATSVVLLPFLALAAVVLALNACLKILDRSPHLAPALPFAVHAFAGHAFAALSTGRNEQELS